MSERNLTTKVVGSGTAEVTYDVRGDLADATAERPVLMIIGSPMDAAGFVTLAGHFEDRPVVTYDPRGAGRNPVDTVPISVEDHAEDLHRVIEDLGVGDVDIFASSGGAVNALRLSELHPDDVNRVVAHEPPTFTLLPDGQTAIGACADVAATYQKLGQGPAMAKFMQLVMHEGEFTEGYADQPAPDPAMFGMSAEDDGSRSDPLMRNMPSCNQYEPDLDKLKALGDRLTIGVGEESGEQPAARGGRSVAAALGVEPVVFPSNHGGFLGGEYGQHGAPEPFAATLHTLLD